jgi:hypothetical protein
MFGYSSLSAVVFVIVLCHTQAIENEPIYSKFEYDKRMLETIVRMEAKMDRWDKERITFEENVLAVLEHRREEMQKKFLNQNKIQNELNDLREKVNNGTLGLNHVPGKI